MTLKDKFDSTIMRHDLGRNEIEETKEQCAEIAEEFAIGFAEYCLKFDNLKNESTYLIEQLLKIYKKEL